LTLIPGILLSVILVTPPTYCEVGSCYQPWRLSYGNMDLWLEELDLLLNHHTHPRPSSGGMGSDVEQWRNLASTYFSDVNTTLCIMSYESGGNPNAKNPNSSARGLMQILASLWAPTFGVSADDLYNPEINLWVAAKVYAQSGWWAWSPYTRGLCRD